MGGVLKPFAVGPARHFLRLLREPEYRALAGLEAQLGRFPRFTPRRVRIRGLDLEVPDVGSFLPTYRSIFVDRIYAFRWREPRAPRILDLGANIGLSVLFFKRGHPAARILALEPDPTMFAILERNLRENGGHDVELLERAAWTGPGRLGFRPDGADGGRLENTRDTSGPAEARSAGALEVEAVSLPALLEREPFDVVKMDIEGAERVVIPACRDVLSAVRYLAIEYHSSVGHPQALAEILGTLEGSGFRVHVHAAFTSLHPLEEARVYEGYDLQLLLFAWRP